MSPPSTSVEAVFQEALALASSAERAAYLERACAGDAGLRRRVEALLRAHDDAGHFLETPVVELGLHEPGEATPAPWGEATPPQRAAWSGAVADNGSLAFLGLPRRPGHLGTLGPYDVLAVLGRGEMGVVLRAYDPLLKRVVAVKVLKPGLAADETARRRFLREARAAAAVRHDHIVTLHAVAVSGDLPYLVMEYVPGTTLQARLRENGPLDIAEVVRLGREIAGGLAAAHARGLIHRDVKPANVLLEEGSGRAKITDFGLARPADAGAVTEVGLVAGTPQYMSPEQAQGLEIDARSDLFSLGCLLYALCTGRPPFRATTTLGVLRRVCEEAPQPVAEVRPEVPDWLAQAIGRLLEKQPDRRFQSAGEVAELLAPHQAPSGQGGTDTLALPGPATPTRVRGKRPVLTPRLWAAAALALVAVALSLGAAARLIRGGGGSPVDPGPHEPAAALDPSPVLPDPAGGRDEDAKPAEEPSQLFGEIRRMQTEGQLTALALSPDGGLVYAGGMDRRIIAWDVKTGQEVRQFWGHHLPIRDLAVSPDGTRLASCGGDRTLRLWDTASGKELAQVRLAVPVWYLTYTPDGKHLLASFLGGEHAAEVARKGIGLVVDHGSLGLFDAATGRLVRSISAHRPRFFWAVALSPDGSRIAAGTDSGSILLFDAGTGQELRELPGVRGPTYALAFSGDGARLYSCGNDNMVTCWDVAGGKEQFRRRFGHPFTGLAVSPDESWVAVNGIPDVRLWDVRNEVGEQGLVQLPGHDAPVTELAFLPGTGRLVTCGRDGTVRVWQLPPRPR